MTQFRRRLLTVFSRFDLRDFPFDQQVLTLTLESVFTIKDVEFRLWEELINVRGATVTGWSLSEHTATTGVDETKLLRRSFFSLSVTAGRDPSTFARKLIVPVGLIVFMAYAIFWISPTQIAPQTGIGATSMLTLIAR